MTTQDCDKSRYPILKQCELESDHISQEATKDYKKTLAKILL